MVTFLDLPREIRDKVYKYSLQVDGEIMTYRDLHHISKRNRPRVPSFSLASVCKLIRQEALETLLGKNVWIIGNQTHYMDGIYHPWIRYHDLFRHVVMYFDRFDMHSKDANTLLEPPASFFRRHGVDDEFRRLAYAHSVNEDLTREIMLDKRDSLEALTGLSTIIFDVEKLLCLSGCCRVEWLKRMLIMFFLDEGIWEQDISEWYEGIDVTIRGVWNEEEVELVREMAPFAKIQMRGDGQAL